MARIVFEYDPPERFVAGTVGEPGQRTFFLQARGGGRMTSVALEKAQVSVLAERVEELLDEVVRRSAGEAGVPAVTPAEAADTEPLDTPIEEEFRVGTMALAWDGDDERVVIEAQALTEDDAEDDEPPLIDGRRRRRAAAAAGAADRRRGPGLRRPARRRVVAAGRPPCPFCGGRWTPAGTSARGPTATGAEAGVGAGQTRRVCQTDPVTQLDVATALDLLRHGEIAVEGRLVDASNATLYCEISSTGSTRPLRLQAGRRGAAAVGLPGRHAGRPRGRGVRGVGGDRLGRRAADRPARRPVRPGHGAAVDRHRATDRRPSAGRRDGARRRVPAGWLRVARRSRLRRRAGGARRTPTTPAAPDGGARRRPQQRRPQGRARPARTGRQRARRRPRRVLPRRAEAAHGAVGLGRRAAARPTRSTC